jgi:hypothetical protein
MLDPCPDLFEGIPNVLRGDPVPVLCGQRIKFSPLAQPFATRGIMLVRGTTPPICR